MIDKFCIATSLTKFKEGAGLCLINFVLPQV